MHGPLGGSRGSKGQGPDAARLPRRRCVAARRRVCVVAAIALGAWYALFRPNLTDLVAAFVPAAPVVPLVLGGLLFSMLNATVEEGAYRGVIQHGLETTIGLGMSALVLQAAAFGALHINGFPRGWAGVGLATMYGLMMGAVRRRSGGMLAPWIAHVLTDIVIVGITSRSSGRPWPHSRRPLRGGNFAD